MSMPSWPPADSEIGRAILSAWEDGSWGQYHGVSVPKLRKALGEFFDAEHVRVCASGTVAVESALHALGADTSSEVILAGYDFGGNFRCIEHLGARPVLVDVNAATGCLDVALLESGRSDQTTAVIVSHLHGGLAPMQSIMEWARTHGIRVLEDACQAHGAIVDGQLAGTWGDIATLSFGGSKLMTAGRGGAVLTSSHELAQRMNVYCEQGNDAYPLSELQAAVLVPQLKKLAERNEVRRRAAARLKLATEKSGELLWVGSEFDEKNQPAYYKLAWLVNGTAMRDEIAQRAHELGVPLQPGFRGFHKRSNRRCRRVGLLEHSAAMADRLLLLHHPWLLLDEPGLAELALKLRQLS